MSRFGYDAGVPLLDWHVSLWKQPRRQDVIVFRSPHDPGTDLVKRIIGMPGDTVEIRRGVVFINGHPLKEPYLTVPPDGNESRGPYQVPPENYFVMGDNRANSFDSRYWGFVPRRNLIGEPVIIYMSIEAPDDAFEPGQLGQRVRAYLNAFVHPGTVRWKRMFRTF
jgi:signal peptidase I